MTPKPESETGSWAEIRNEIAMCREKSEQWDVSLRSVRPDITADVLAAALDARAAEAAQYQQEMSQQAAHIANLEHMVREHGQFGDLFQPGGRFHKDAQLEPGSVAVVAGGKWLVARLAAVEAERDQLTRRRHDAACELRGPGGAVDRRCSCGFRAVRAEVAALRAERDRLTAAALAVLLNPTCADPDCCTTAIKHEAALQTLRAALTLRASPRTEKPNEHRDSAEQDGGHSHL